MPIYLEEHYVIFKQIYTVLSYQAIRNHRLWFTYCSVEYLNLWVPKHSKMKIISCKQIIYCRKKERSE